MYLATATAIAAAPTGTNPTDKWPLVEVGNNVQPELIGKDERLAKCRSDDACDDPGDNSNDVQGESTHCVALLCSSHAVGQPFVESDNNVDALLVRARAPVFRLGCPEARLLRGQRRCEVAESRIRQRPGHNGRQLILCENQRTVATLGDTAFGPRHAVDRTASPSAFPLSVALGMNCRRWRCSCSTAAYSSPGM